ncbi:hypothetical protein Ddc_12486 [Ditylenchus destructor]|nr:hypothetical protein Ddc_12486 [Ditylenchus destructor]
MLCGRGQRFLDHSSMDRNGLLSLFVGCLPGTLHSNSLDLEEGERGSTCKSWIGVDRVNNNGIHSANGGATSRSPDFSHFMCDFFWMLRVPGLQ